MSKTKKESSSSSRSTIGLKRPRKSYTLGQDYEAWKQECDRLKSEGEHHGREATRLRNSHKKLYAEGADGYCLRRDDSAWDQANNLLTLAELKEDERANAWKSLPITKLDLPPKLLGALEEHFCDLEEVCSWIGRDFRDKKRGIGHAAIDKIRDALDAVIAPYHAPIIQAELERAKGLLATLTK